MRTVAVIMARAGSKGLPDKCVLPLCGRPVIAYCISHARQSRRTDQIVLTTDSAKARQVALDMQVAVVDRPAELASDTARVDAVVRHAVQEAERRAGVRCDAVVILYGNVPIRAEGAIDRCIEHLEQTGCDSVRTVAPLTKHHPDWTHRLDGDRLVQYRPNSIHRRQDLEPLYYHDGAVVAVTRQSLFAAEHSADPHAFFGQDRRAVVHGEQDTVDIDSALDFHLAEAMLRSRFEFKAGAQDSFFASARLYVIAEAGVNHNGDVETARRLIEAARDTGADAVKFQVFAANRLVTRTAAAARYQQNTTGAVSQHELLSKLELSYEVFADLAAYARQVGIDFLATPFSVEDLQFLTTLNVRAIKLASPDIINGPLLDAAAATRLPILASTGAAELGEIAEAVQRLRNADAGPVALLHCISSYPAREDEANLAAIATLARTFGGVAGFSDHTPSLTLGGYAAAAGARVIEKHLTLDRHQSGPDHAFSLEPADMTVYIQNIRQTQPLLGDGQIHVTDSQRDVRQLSRCSVVTRCEIPAGVRIEATMLTAKRPGSGISPMRVSELIGRVVKKTVPADSLLCWDDLE